MTMRLHRCDRCGAFVGYTIFVGEIQACYPCTRAIRDQAKVYGCFDRLEEDIQELKDKLRMAELEIMLRTEDAKRGSQ